MNISELCGDSFMGSNGSYSLIHPFSHKETHTRADVNTLTKLHPTTIHPLDDAYNNSHTIHMIENSNSLLKHIILQCLNINKEIARYRVDPLTEKERITIVDEVYYTTEHMLQSLRTIEEYQHILCKELDIKLSTNSKNEISIINNTHSSDNIINQNIKTTLHNNSIDGTSSSSSNTTSTTTTNIHTPTTTNTTTTIITTSTPSSATSDYDMIRQARNLQDNSRPKYKRRNRRSIAGQRCHSCQTTETPEWRRGPDGGRTLCNACGLHYSKLLRKGSLTVQAHNCLMNSPNINHTRSLIQFSNVSTTKHHKTMPLFSTTESVYERNVAKLNMNTNNKMHGLMNEESLYDISGLSQINLNDFCSYS